MSEARQVVLVVAAHPDDEILGCGGTIAWHTARGDIVEILILAEGATSRDRADSEGVLALQVAARQAASVLGAQPPRFGGLPDNRMDSVDLLDIVLIVEHCVKTVRPTIVYTHHGADLNIDHRLCHQAVLAACRPLPDQVVQSIYAFETVSSSEWQSVDQGGVFHPTLFIDVSPYIADKMKALGAYVSEMRPFPHPRSLENIEALAVFRGASSGLIAAEAFSTIRIIRRNDVSYKR